MNRLFASLALLTIFIGLSISCDNLKENYETNPNLRLTFSVDTLSFDTVFTSIGSATRHFMIYNPHQSPLLISEAYLVGGDSKGFRINVDGRKGDHFTDVRIPANDSLYVHVEVTVRPEDADQPILVNDSICFTINGNRQFVLLEAYGQNVHLWKGGTLLDKDTILTANRPYLIYDSLKIGGKATVTILPGAIFYLHNEANIINEGTLLALGEQGHPILFRGDRNDDALANKLPYDHTPSQWGGIFFRAESFHNVMEHVILRNSSEGIVMEASDTLQSKLKLSNSQLKNSGGNLLTAYFCDAEIINTEISNAGGMVVSLTGGKYRFIHATLANYMILVDRSFPCLCLSNQGNGIQMPLSVSFDNCIIDGSFSSGKNELSGEIMIEGDMEDIHYRFNHCLLKSKGSAQDQIINTIFTDLSPSYRMLGKEENQYSYDFHLDSLTTLGVGKADLVIATRYPIDMLGNSRLTEDGPDIGAYEYIAPPEE